MTTTLFIAKDNWQMQDQASQYDFQKASPVPAAQPATGFDASAAHPRGPSTAHKGSSMPPKAHTVMPIGTAQGSKQGRARGTAASKGRATGSKPKATANRADSAGAVSKSLPTNNGAQDGASSGVRDGGLANPKHCSHCWATSESFCQA